MTRKIQKPRDADATDRAILHLAKNGVQLNLALAAIEAFPYLKVLAETNKQGMNGATANGNGHNAELEVDKAK